MVSRFDFNQTGQYKENQTQLQLQSYSSTFKMVNLTQITVIHIVI